MSPDRNRFDDFHCGIRDLDEYYSGDMSYPEAALLEEHLGGCSRCMDWSGEIGADLIEFEQWTAEAHGAAYLLEESAIQGHAAAAITRLKESADPSIRDRLQRWTQELSETLGCAVRFAVTGDTIASLGEGADFGMRLVTTEGPVVRLRSDARTRGTAQTRESGSLVTLGGKEGAVHIRIDNPPPGLPPLLMLVPLSEGSAPATAGLTLTRSNPPCWSARFEHVPRGHYVLLFEPSVKWA